jgi:hypothetical protein
MLPLYGQDTAALQTFSGQALSKIYFLENVFGKHSKNIFAEFMNFIL